MGRTGLGILPGLVGGVGGGGRSRRSCKWKDWDKWESPTAAWGEGTALGDRGVTAGRKGWGWVQVSEQPLVPSCKEGRRNQWGMEQHEAGRSSSPTETYINNLIRQKHASQLRFIRENFPGVITWQAAPSHHTSTFMPLGRGALLGSSFSSMSPPWGWGRRSLELLGSGYPEIHLQGP